MNSPVPTAWKIDATDFASGGIGVFVPNSRFDEFKRDPQKRIFAGGKGMGKSLLLQKNCLHLSGRAQHIFLPKNKSQRVELMGKLSITYTSETMRLRGQTLDSTDWWELVWSVSFVTVAIFHACKDFVASDIWQFLGVTVRPKDPTKRGDLLVHQVVHKLVLSQKSREELGTLFAQLKPALGKLINTVVISIDNVDEAFQPSTSEKAEQKAIEKDEWNLGSDFSLTAQIGLLATIRALRPYESLQIYATLRIEALDKRMASMHPMFGQERALCLELKPDKDLSRLIFEANIAVTPDHQCARPEERGNPYVRFIGFDTVPLGAPAGGSEHVFDFIYRHTLGLPRDLVSVGKGLSELGSNKGNLRHVQDQVYGCAGRCLNIFESAILPAWDRRWSAAFGEFGCNVLSENEMVRLSNLITEKHKIPDPITYLVNRGLMGYLRRNDGRERDEIHFRAPFRYITESKVDLRRSRYFFLHPILHGAVRSANNFFVIDRTVVIGNGYPFERPWEGEQLRLDCLDLGEVGGPTVEFDGRTVRSLEARDNIVAPLFAAITCAAWRYRSKEVSFELFEKELRRILKSKIVEVNIHGQPLQNWIEYWVSGSENCDYDIYEAIADINAIFRRHMWITLKEVGGKEATAIDYISWNGEYFQFMVCDPGRIDCGRFCEEVKRRCGNADHSSVSKDAASRF